MSGFKSAFAIVATLILIPVSSVYLVRLWLAHENTPANQPDWTLTKSVMPRIMGIKGCMDGPQMYAGNQLNLNVWHGYQEVLYHKPIQLQKVSFRFWVEEEGYVIFLGYNKRGYFDAFRFSAREELRSAWITGHRTGRFKKATTGNPAIFYPYQWHDVEMYFDSGVMRLVVDNVPIAKFPTGLMELAQVGFRSGMKNAKVDDVVFEMPDGTVIREDFRNSEGEARIAVVLCFSLSILLLLMVLFAKSSKMDKKGIIDLVFVSASTLLLISVILYHFYTSFYAFTYPVSEGKLFAIETGYIEELLKARSQEFKEKYTTEKADDEVRVLFIGTSQTYGEGSMKEGGGFVSLTNSYLGKLMPEVNVNVMNGACEGAVAEQLLELYKESYREYKPDIMVINLGVNDQQRESFGPSLEEFIALNNEDGIKTILMQEAVSPEDPQGRPKTLAIIREVAEKHGIPLVDSCKYLWNLRTSGFLFWDNVHPTDYGHDLISQSLLPTLMKSLKETAFERGLLSPTETKSK